ncbi:hypothetical protein CKAN_02717700 [Cinnamomum micranthum f. kanehirae]|uniref:Uncharacterized protein n=1 Tax=Cinnamomum micranthum f. kanehirae TaxID=337451 RepID=A0A3S3PBM9_9MAGN|nr:hypothetical protein CKAN_02717700 [Cinnamomum micranthum f. kanehirae]
MRDMGYDLEEPVGLKNGRGIKVPLEPHLSEEQREAWLAGQYVDLTTYGLGYQPTTLPAPKTVSDAESSDTESCDSEISVSDLFKSAERDEVTRDFSPVSAKMLRSLVGSVATPIFSKIRDVTDLGVLTPGVARAFILDRVKPGYFNEKEIEGLRTFYPVQGEDFLDRLILQPWVKMWLKYLRWYAECFAPLAAEGTSQTSCFTQNPSLITANEVFGFSPNDKPRPANCSSSQQWKQFSAMVSGSSVVPGRKEESRRIHRSILERAQTDPIHGDWKANNDLVSSWL